MGLTRAALRVWPRGWRPPARLADYQVEGPTRARVVLDVLHRLQGDPGPATWPSGGTARPGPKCGVVLDGDQRPAAAGLCMTLDMVGLLSGGDAWTITPRCGTFPGDQGPWSPTSRFKLTPRRGKIPSFTPDPSVKPG